jgi:hypothetical protein
LGTDGILRTPRTSAESCPQSWGNYGDNCEDRIGVAPIALTDVAVRTAKPREKSYKLFDSGGLYLEVSPSGGKWWRFKFRAAGTAKRLSLGIYPDVPLKAAREKRDAARRQLAAGIDPGVASRAQKQAQAGAESFEAIAREWHEKFAPGWEGTSAKTHPAAVRAGHVPMDREATDRGTPCAGAADDASAGGEPGSGRDGAPREA